jgi:DNA-binding response OmpR family regulator
MLIILLTLPMAGCSNDSKSIASRACPMESICVLAIDDDPMMRTLLNEILHRDSFEVELASSGEEGIRIARQHLPDIILLDVNLPGVGGVEVLQALRHEPQTRHIPILFLTADLDPHHLVEALEADPDDYVSKNVSPRELVARIKWVLRRRLR